ncbi:MAG: 50S ribosomal protein L20 [Bacteroidota bacterium]
MPRSVNSVASRARRKKVLKKTRGYWGKRKNIFSIAKNIYDKGLTYAYVGRKKKKRVYRNIWVQRINAAVREHGLSYSNFISLATKKNLGINRKVMADLAMNYPKTFSAVVDAVK